MDQHAPFRVIANCEDEYAILPLRAPMPSAWRSVGMTGTYDECARYIRAVDTAAGVVVRRLVEREMVKP